MGRFQTVYFLSAVLAGANTGPLFSLGINNNSAREFGRESYRLEEAPGSANDRDDHFYLAGTYPDPIGVVDRHGTPLIVHPISRKLLEIRFAGPDRKPYTSDALVWPSPAR